MHPPGSNQPIPVSLITGFLGSGKTTLLNRVVSDARMKDSAVIINEFGEIGLDHLLVESTFEDVLLMKSGCICCTIRGDLADTLDTLLKRAQSGEIPGFRRVLIETTGLAEPGPILHSLADDPAIAANYRLGAVVATVDAVNGAGQIAEHGTAVNQIAAADRLLLTKTDIAPESAAGALKARVAEINPLAPIYPVIEGRIDPDLLFDLDALSAETVGRRAVPLADGHHDHSHGAHDDHAHEASHIAEAGIHSFALTFDEPLDWPTMRDWLQALSAFRGGDVLRVKGIVDVQGRDRPTVINGVQHVFHAPGALAAWPDGQRRSQIVFIVRNLERAAVEASLRKTLARAA